MKEKFNFIYEMVKKNIACNFKTTGRYRAKKNNLDELMTFNEFIKSGLKNK